MLAIGIFYFSGTGNTEIKGDFITDKTKGYFKHFYKYLNKDLSK